MLYLEIFLAFFIPNIIGYGGGPAIIPLIEAEVVSRYGWMDATQFAETLALGNALPSPIATKMAGHIGYDVGGVWGGIVAVIATVAPSLLLMLGAIGLMVKFKDSVRVKRMGRWVLPVVAVLMALLTISFLRESLGNSGPLHTSIIAAVAALLLIRLKLHPAIAVGLALIYGAVFLG